MRKYLHINLKDRSIRIEELNGEAVIRVGRHFIAKTLLQLGVAKVDPLSPENPLIFSAGPFAGTNFSNANRISVGCKSPLTGGIKEANSGGRLPLRWARWGLPGSLSTASPTGSSSASPGKGITLRAPPLPRQGQ
jgi:aldehyde:ferredoxin oxidoreductase